MNYSKFFSPVLRAGKKLKEMASVLRESQSSWEDAQIFVQCQLMVNGLLDAYDEDYPLVEARELIPAFDSPLIEYVGLPAFSALMLNRRLSYMDENFQYDRLQPEGNPVDTNISRQNLAAIKSRLPRNIKVNHSLARSSLTQLATYGSLLPLLFAMDRGQVMARNRQNRFYLAGIFASFPSDLDKQIKRVGNQLGKFKKKDNRRYAQNRQFVYSYLMESLGFPVCGERHTSAALFALNLLRAGEVFSIMVLGHSDRAITVLSNPEQGETAILPAVKKIAMVATPEYSPHLDEQGFYVDPKRRAVLLEVQYQHHRYHPDNALEGRALSVKQQTIIHPVTGEAMEFDVLGLSQENLLMLDLIVQGKFNGTIVYQDSKTVRGTKSIPNRLKFLSAWLHKHRFILAEYSMDNIDRLNSLLSQFLYDQEREKVFSRYSNLYMQVHKAWQDLLLAHRLRMLEKIVSHSNDDKRVSDFEQARIFTILSQILNLEGTELMKRSPDDFKRLLRLCSKEINVCYALMKGGREFARNTLDEMGHLKKLAARHKRELNRFLKSTGHTPV